MRADSATLAANFQHHREAESSRCITLGMKSMSADKQNIKQRLGEELRTYAYISFYLWICFGALLLYKVSIMRADDIAILPFGLAAIKALILGKFVLIGQSVKVGNQINPTVLLHRIIWKSIRLFLLLLLFTVIEELLVGLVHGHSLASLIHEFTAKPPLQILAPCVVVLLVLVPLVAYQEIDEVLGKGGLRKMLMNPKSRH